MSNKSQHQLGNVVKRVTKYLMDHYGIEFTCASMAASMGLNASTVNDAVNKLMASPVGSKVYKARRKTSRSHSENHYSWGRSSVSGSPWGVATKPVNGIQPTGW